MGEDESGRRRASLYDYWERAWTFPEMLEKAQKNKALWADIHRRVRVAPALLERVAAVPGRWHLLVLSEDWCGDAVNTVPLVDRLAEAAPNLDMRILARDENPALMDTHLTGTSRSIPVVMVLDEAFHEHGWWGPRPLALQRWFHETGRSMPPEERYREIRRWYARDRGASTLAEVVALIEKAASGTGGGTGAA